MVKKDKTMTIISKSCHHYEKREWIQNGYYQNGECYKTAKSQNGDCYKTLYCFDNHRFVSTPPDEVIDIRTKYIGSCNVMFLPCWGWYS